MFLIVHQRTTTLKTTTQQNKQISKQTTIKHTNPTLLMTENTIFRKVRTLLSNLLGLEASEIEPESELDTDLGADSLDLAEFVMAVEEEFDVEIRENDTDDIHTIQDVVDWLYEQIGD